MDDHNPSLANYVFPDLFPGYLVRISINYLNMI
jgi:hypothetical protein